MVFSLSKPYLPIWKIGQKIQSEVLKSRKNHNIKQYKRGINLLLMSMMEMVFFSPHDSFDKEV